ncbi:DUF2785 domain-containing protein, partial [Paraclostridium sordellii 8483]|uniref:DUF2785 domain-containing protein n=1 Tax=Paraclostridium sordellii TaxID=1505 RepID=UPI00102F2233
MTEDILKLKLTQIKKDNYAINCEKLYYSYALDMLKHIGTTDPTLRDLRGYIDNKGWAHSVAHGADVIDELAKCSVLCKEDLNNLLMILKLKICQGKYVYIDGETDRISIAVRSIFMRYEIDEGDILLWLESFKGYSYINESSIECYHQNVNITNFLKSLYFTLKS